MGGANTEPVRLLNRWIQHCAGCDFASTLVKGEKVSFFSIADPAVEWTDDDVDDFESAIEQAAASGICAIGLDVIATTGADAAALLRRLHDREAWKVSIIGATDAPIVKLALHYLSGARRSSVMGLAPFGTMPVTRRAPFVSLVVWGGAAGTRKIHEKARHAPDEHSIGLVDIPIRLDDDPFDTAWKNTIARTKARLVLPPFSSKVLRDVCFMLERGDVEKGFPELLAPPPAVEAPVKKPRRRRATK